MTILDRMDALVDAYAQRVEFFYAEPTPASAKMWIKQHWLNSRYRNSVLKPVVAANCPDFDMRCRILKAVYEEVIADHEYADGKPHWQMLEDLGVTLGMTVAEIQEAEPLPSTRMAWLAWESLLKHRHWLLGVAGMSCSERGNVPGHGRGELHELGHAGLRRITWARALGLKDEQLGFFISHVQADAAHSNLGWQAVAEHAERLGMEDDVLAAVEQNLQAWEMYWDGILTAARRDGDR